MKVTNNKTRSWSFLPHMLSVSKGKGSQWFCYFWMFWVYDLRKCTYLLKRAECKIKHCFYEIEKWLSLWCLYTHCFKMSLIFSPQISYMISAWARMCKILGKEFQQYLPVVMGPLMKTASIKPEVALLDSRCLHKNIGVVKFFSVIIFNINLFLPVNSTRHGEYEWWWWLGVCEPWGSAKFWY